MTSIRSSRPTPLMALACLTLLSTTQAMAQYNAFWSFDEFQSGDGSFTTVVTADTWNETPTLSYAGSVLLTSGGATSFTAYDGKTWLGSGGSSTPGHSLAWSGGSSGNSFEVTLDMADKQSLQLQMDIRSYTGGVTSFADLQYDIGSGFVSSGIALSPIVTGTSYVRWTLDLSALSAINDQSSVILRWVIADIPGGSSLRIDNLQLSASAIPEPASMSLALLAGACVVLARWRTRR